MKKLFVIFIAFLGSYSLSKSQPDTIPGLLLWYCADSGITANGFGNVSQWDDLGSFSNNAVQANSSKQPVLIPNVLSLNHHSCVRFDGSDDFMAFSLINTIRSVFIVCKHTTGTSGGYEPLLGTTANAMFVGGLGDKLFSPGYMPAYLSGGSFSVNGQLLPVSNINKPITYSLISIVTLDNAEATYITNDRNLYGWWNGDFADIVIYDRVLSSAEQDSVENYLMRKYSQPLSLGNDTIVGYGFCPVTLTADSIYSSYNWSTGETTNSIQVTQSGEYSLTVTDVFGMSYIDSINVTFPGVFNCPVSLCLGDTIDYTTGLGSDYSFLWQDSSTDSILHITTDGDYFVIVSDTIAGCPDFYSDTIHVTTDTFPNLNILPDSISVCNGDTVSAFSNNAVSYEWSDLSNLHYFIATTPGWVYVTLTNSNGCKAIDSVEVFINGSRPDPVISHGLLCSQSVLSFYGSSTGNIQTWQWNIGGVYASSEQNPEVPDLAPGIYTTSLNVTDVNTCSSVVFSVDTVFTRPSAGIISIGGCVGSETVFMSDAVSSDSIISYVWSVDGNALFTDSFSYLFFSPGHYIISHSVLTELGCSDTSEVDLLVANSFPLPTTATLSYPVNGQNIIGPLATLSWEQSDSTAYYKVEFASDASFVQTYFISDWLITNQYDYLISSSDSVIYWRVWSYNPCGNSTHSSAYSFSCYTPLSSSGISLWYSASSGILSGPQNKVSVWPDQGLVLNDAFQNDTSKQPRLIENVVALNNLSTVRFDGANDFMEFNLLNDVRTVFVFCKHKTGTSTLYEPLLGHPIDIMFIGALGTPMFSPQYMPAQIQNANFYVNGSLFSVATIQKSTDYKIYTIKTTTSATSQYITNDRNQHGWWNGEMAEIIIYNQPLDDVNRGHIEKYIMDKYAPPVYLGSDIQSKLFCPISIEAGERFNGFLWSTGSNASSINVNQSGKYWVRVTDIFGRVSSDTINVVFPEDIKDTLFCANDSVLLATPLSGTYSYLWSNGSITEQTYYNYGGICWLETTDDSSCSRRDSFIIVVDSIFYKATIGNDTALCSGNILSLQNGQQNAVSYLWSPGGETTASIIINTTGDYSLTVTSANGCIAKDSIYISIHGTAPTASFTTQNQCFGDSLVISDTSYPNDLSNINQWQWTFHDGQVLSGDSVVKKKYAAPGIYPVTLSISTDSLCSSSVTLQVQVFYLPEIDFGSTNPCSDHPIQIINNSSVTGGFLANYLWVINGTDSFDVYEPLYNAGGPGFITAYLQTTSNQGCSVDTTVTIEIKQSPLAQFDVSPSCSERKTYFFDLSESPVYHPIMAWEWDLGDAGIVSSVRNPDHIYLTPGNYDVSLMIISLNGCKDEYLKTVQVSATPVAGFLGDKACVGVPMELSDTSNVENGYIYQRNWEVQNMGIFTDSSLSLTFMQSGDYLVSLEVISELNCKDDTSSFIRVYNLPNAQFTSTDSLGPAPLYVQYTNQSDEGTYLWDFDDGTISVLKNPGQLFADTGTYQVVLVVTDINGCVQQTSQIVKVVTNQYDLAILAMDTIVSGNIKNISVAIANFGTLPVENPYLLVNLPNSQPFTETINLTLNPAQIYYFIMSTGVYINEATDRSYVCAEIMLPEIYGVDENLLNNEFCITSGTDFSILRIYPNPASDDIIIEFSSGSVMTAELTINTTKGQKISQQEVAVNRGMNRIKLDVSMFSDGVYFLKFRYNEGVAISKFVKSVK